MWMIKKLIKEQPDNASIGLPLGMVRTFISK